MCPDQELHLQPFGVWDNAPTNWATQTFKEEIISIIYKLFQRTEAGKVFPNSFYEASITLITKPEKYVRKNKLQASTSHENTCKTPQPSICKWDPKKYKMNNIPWPSGI